MVGVELQVISNADAAQYSFLLKLVVVGPESGGKSSAVQRYVNQTFSPTYMATIGVDLTTKTVRTDDGKIIKLQIWDTSGQERFRVISSSYYRGAHGAMLAFDITNRSSFNAIPQRYEEVNAKTMDDCPLVLIGTKMDLEDQRQVSFEEAETFATKHDMAYIEISSKTGYEVVNGFQTLIKQALTKQHGSLLPKSDTSSGTKIETKTTPTRAEQTIKTEESKTSTAVTTESSRSESSRKVPQKSKTCTVL